MNTTGYFNTASGTSALLLNETGADNTASGSAALRSNTTGNQNTASGGAALYSNTTGSGNAALGYAAGTNATSGSYNVFLGADVVGTAADTNTIRIGLPYSGGVGQNQTFIAGIHGTQLTGPAMQVFIDANGQLGTLTPPIATGQGRRSRLRWPSNRRCRRSKPSSRPSRRRLMTCSRDSHGWRLLGVRAGGRRLEPTRPGIDTGALGGRAVCVDAAQGGRLTPPVANRDR